MTFQTELGTGDPIGRVGKGWNCVCNYLFWVNKVIGTRFSGLRPNSSENQD